MWARRLANPKPIAQTKGNQRLAADFLLFVRTLTRKAVRPRRAEAEKTRSRVFSASASSGARGTEAPQSGFGRLAPEAAACGSHRFGAAEGTRKRGGCDVSGNIKGSGLPLPRLGVMPTCWQHPDGAGTPLSAKAHTCASREKGGLRAPKRMCGDARRALAPRVSR